jgi:hypothetical protein
LSGLATAAKRTTLLFLSASFPSHTIQINPRTMQINAGFSGELHREGVSQTLLKSADC